MYFSEEITNAEKYGYKFNITSGYMFDKHDIFADFIEVLYKIKESHKKDDP